MMMTSQSDTELTQVDVPQAMETRAAKPIDDATSEAAPGNAGSPELALEGSLRKLLAQSRLGQRAFDVRLARGGTPLSLDFAPNAHPSHWIGSGLFALLVLALAWQGIQLATVFQERRHEVATLASLSAPKAVAGSLGKAGKLDPSQAARLRAARQVEQGLDKPWADLLNALEDAPHQAVALISVEPSASKQTVRLTAEARDSKEMLAYVGALQKDARLTAVVLVSHQVQAQAPGEPVRFQLQAEWGRAR